MSAGVGVAEGGGLASGVAEAEAEAVADGCALALAVEVADDDGVTTLVGDAVQAAALTARVLQAARPISRR